MISIAKRGAGWGGDGSGGLPEGCSLLRQLRVASVLGAIGAEINICRAFFTSPMRSADTIAASERWRSASERCRSEGLAAALNSLFSERSTVARQSCSFSCGQRDSRPRTREA